MKSRGRFFQPSERKTENKEHLSGMSESLANKIRSAIFLQVLQAHILEGSSTIPKRKLQACSPFIDGGLLPVAQDKLHSYAETSLEVADILENTQREKNKNRDNEESAENTLYAPIFHLPSNATTFLSMWNTYPLMTSTEIMAITTPTQSMKATPSFDMGGPSLRRG